jgi:hypothetical protein
MMRRVLLAAAAVLLAAPSAHGQTTISAGMSPAQVRSAFGAPATVRRAGDWTYWYYHNGCPRRCGSDDVVFFQAERVVAAVLRTGRRRFDGPAADRALEAATAAESRAGADGAPVTVGGLRVEDAPAATIRVEAPDDAAPERRSTAPRAPARP